LLSITSSCTSVEWMLATAPNEMNLRTGGKTVV
jgi:hypothetical protein